MEQQTSLVEFIGWLTIGAAVVFALIRFRAWWDWWKYTASAKAIFRGLGVARDFYLAIFFGLVAFAIIAALIRGGPLW